MTRKQIKLLAENSFVKKNLDQKKVLKFTKEMRRKELREYLRAIKSIDSKNKVTIIVPSLSKFKKTDLSNLSKIYIGKEIIYKEDPSLLVGVKIINNDIVQDFNLKNSLESINEMYD